MSFLKKLKESGFCDKAVKEQRNHAGLCALCCDDIMEEFKNDDIACDECGANFCKNCRFEFNEDADTYCLPCMNEKKDLDGIFDTLKHIFENRDVLNTKLFTILAVKREIFSINKKIKVEEEQN